MSFFRRNKRNIRQIATSNRTSADIYLCFTLKDALDEGFKVTLMEDAVRPLDEKEFEKQKSELIKKGVVIDICP